MLERKPKRILPHNASEMLMGWNTGESYVIPYSELRFECPCAHCVDELTGQRTIKREKIAQGIRPVDIQPVGHYAVQITWSDGHSTGIYPFDKLWGFCQRLGRLIEA